ncbi:hypothetical protein [Knoellia sp. LjRoot47]|uniref:hypothetical protein n=1 Tax=Knoellia sp. LjRoot47 TaxID=3342330 RepID=UPI003ECDEB66
MSSSANRRPRVAGQRRRPARPDGSVVDPTTSPAEHDETVGAGEHDETVEADDTDGTDQASPAAADDPDDTHLDDAIETDTHDDDDGATPVSRAALLASAVALALSLALLAALLLVTREDPAQRGRDASAASATARSTLEQILSYNAETMTQQIPANQALLAGTFKDEFATTMTKTIVPLATKDKTVVKARAYEVGVMSQDDDTVTVQAFVDQARTSDAQKQPSIDQNRVIATMTRVGNRWLVSSLKAY